jgi:sphingomyelin phosphodiesterase acid-like 3
MLSDIHFDPFHDPAKFAQLRKAPAAEWAAILDAPDTPTQGAEFAHLQSVCGARGVDTPVQLLESSLHAAKLQQPKPLFVTLSGDLMAHQFDCRFHTLAPGASSAEYSEFAAQTVRFVALQLRRTYPHTPVYITLGNNDSGCTDYSEDTGSAFLQADSHSIAEDTGNAADAAAVLREFPPLGDYTIPLPAPVQHTRMIALQDIFEAKRYTTCGGEKTQDPAAAQIAWLRAQLTAARAAHEHVWLMAHMPPGVDAYSTLAHGRNVCAGDAPEGYLSSDDLLKAITDFGDVIRLALFGHTHMDELRVYASSVGGQQVLVPGKLVPSISPVSGNDPAFTVAQIDPASAMLSDYTVFAADNQTGVGTKWKQEYRYSADFGMPDLSGASLQKLVSGFIDDKSGTQPATLDYQQHFFVGGSGKASIAMKLAWPAYACVMGNGTAASFRACVCPAKPENASASAP